MKNYIELAKKVRVLVGRGETEEVFNFLHAEEITSIEEDLRVIEARYNRVQKNQINGTIDSAAASIELNSINMSLLNLAREIEKIPEKKQLAKNKPETVPERHTAPVGFYTKIIAAVLVLVVMGFFAVKYFSANQKDATALNRLLNEAGARYGEKDFKASLLLYDSSLVIAGQLKDQGLRDSIEKLKRLVEVEVSMFDSLINSAHVYFTAGQFPEAKTNYVEAQNLWPKGPAEIQDRIDQCEASIQETHRELIRKADSLYKNRKCAEAKTTYLEALNLLPSDSAAIQQKIKQCEECLVSSDPCQIKLWEKVYLYTMLNGEKKYVKTDSDNFGTPLYVTNLEGKNAYQEFLIRKYHEPTVGRDYPEYTFSSGLKDFRIFGTTSNIIGEEVRIKQWDHQNYSLRWKLEPVTNKGFKIKNSVTGFYLGLNNTGHLLTVREDQAPIWRLENYFDMGF